MRQMTAAPSESVEELHGHALMASFQPLVHQHSISQSSFPYEQIYLGSAHLATLLEMSKQLNLDGELTPVMAWGVIITHPRNAEITPTDVKTIEIYLADKVRCYGLVFDLCFTSSSMTDCLLGLGPSSRSLSSGMR